MSLHLHKHTNTILITWTTLLWEKKLIHFGEAAAGNLLRGRDAQTWNTPCGTPPWGWFPSAKYSTNCIFKHYCVAEENTRGLSSSEASLGLDFYWGSGPDDNGTHMQKKKKKPDCPTKSLDSFLFCLIITIVYILVIIGEHHIICHSTNLFSLFCSSLHLRGIILVKVDDLFPGIWLVCVCVPLACCNTTSSTI